MWEFSGWNSGLPLWLDEKNAWRKSLWFVKSILVFSPFSSLFWKKESFWFFSSKLWLIKLFRKILHESIWLFIFSSKLIGFSNSYFLWSFSQVRTFSIDFNHFDFQWFVLWLITQKNDFQFYTLKKKDEWYEFD